VRSGRDERSSMAGPLGGWGDVPDSDLRRKLSDEGRWRTVARRVPRQVVRAGSGCLNSFPRMISGVPPGFVRSMAPLRV
jgi:hypothetical protein